MRGWGPWRRVWRLRDGWDWWGCVDDNDRFFFLGVRLGGGGYELRRGDEGKEGREQVNNEKESCNT